MSPVRVTLFYIERVFSAWGLLSEWPVVFRFDLMLYSRYMSSLCYVHTKTELFYDRRLGTAVQSGAETPSVSQKIWGHATRLIIGNRGPFLQGDVKIIPKRRWSRPC